MRRGTVAAVGGLLLVVLAGACDDSSASDAKDAKLELRAAARRTLTAQSYKIRMGQVDVKKPHMATVRYQAPDRSRSVSGRNEQIQIGNTVYMRSPDGSSGFTRQTLPASVGGPDRDLNSLLYLALHTRSRVSVDGDTYKVTTAKQGGLGGSRWTYRVSNGRVVNIRIDELVHAKTFNRVFHIYDFGVPNTIEAPVDEPIHEAVPPPECPPGGEPPPAALMCVTTAIP